MRPSPACVVLFPSPMCWCVSGGVAVLATAARVVRVVSGVHFGVFSIYLSIYLFIYTPIHVRVHIFRGPTAT